MRATHIYGAGDTRLINVPDPSFLLLRGTRPRMIDPVPMSATSVAGPSEFLPRSMNPGSRGSSGVGDPPRRRCSVRQSCAVGKPARLAATYPVP